MRHVLEVEAADWANATGGKPPRADRACLLCGLGYGDGGNLAYAATVSREDSVRAAREWLKHVGGL